MTSMTRTILTPSYIASAAGLTIVGTMLTMALGNVISGHAHIAYQTPPFALVLHIATVIPALPLGLYVLTAQKGGARHKMLGRVWGVLMLITAITSFWLRGITGGLSPIHIFSVITLISIPRGIWLAKQGRIAAHQRAMTGPYIGLVVAGMFAFIPGRMLGTLAFG
ncbi:MAG: hypothetical protein RL367_1561 [Pseudomonadota bacterium]|jgi:uncharacterized membrane protein